MSIIPGGLLPGSEPPPQPPDIGKPGIERKPPFRPQLPPGGCRVIFDQHLATDDIPSKGVKSGHVYWISRPIDGERFLGVEFLAVRDIAQREVKAGHVYVKYSCDRDAECGCEPPAPPGCCFWMGYQFPEEQAPCLQLGGQWFEDACESSLGACCRELDQCILLTIGQCNQAAGTFLGAGTSCDGTCSQLTLGACCLGPTQCQNMSPLDCAVAGGIYIGDGSACQQGLCNDLF